MKRYTWSIAGLVALLLMLTLSQAKAVLLSDLIKNSGTLVIGDKTFSNFNYTSASGGLVDPSAISVLTINPRPMVYGLEFQGAWSNPTPSTTLDGLLSYTVTSSGSPIIDAELYGNPDMVDGAGNTAGTGLMSITESLINPSNNVVVGKLSIHDSASYAPGQGTTHNSISDDHIYFAPIYQLNIKKDMMFRNSGLEPTLSFVDQTYSQVPEPGTIGMLIGSGVPGLMLLIRKRCLNH